MHVKVQNFSNNFFHQQIYGSNNGSIANEFTAKSWEKSLVGGSIRVSRIGVGYEGYDGREIPPNIGLNRATWGSTTLFGKTYIFR